MTARSRSFLVRFRSIGRSSCDRSRYSRYQQAAPAGGSKPRALARRKLLSNCCSHCSCERAQFGTAAFIARQMRGDNSSAQAGSVTESAAIATISAFGDNLLMHLPPAPQPGHQQCRAGYPFDEPSKPKARIYLPDSSDIIGPISNCRREADNW